MIIFISCRKDYSCENCKQIKPPIADAGADQDVTLPKDSVLLDGSASKDPDGVITSYHWTKISRLSSFNIVNANSAQARVAGLAQGEHQFELTVTDAEGLSSKDTVRIMVEPQPYTCGDTARPHINARLVPVGNLSEARYEMSVASSGSKVLFAAGSSGGLYSSTVDILDVTTLALTTAKLCIGRTDIAAVSSGNKIFFAGGEISDGTFPVDSVDIYDVSTNTWQTARLSAPGNGIAAAAVGNKVLFVGGDQGFNTNASGIIPRHNAIDIYNVSNDTWSTASLGASRSPLSTPRRGGHAAVTAGTKVYVAGGGVWPNAGVTNIIDIYDNATNSWSTSTLRDEKIYMAAVTVGNKIYWAGSADNYNACCVEIRDVSTGTSVIQQLSGPASFSINRGQNAVVKDNKIIFYSTSDFSKLDIYDIATNTWSIGVLPISISGASIISVNNTVYIAGGWLNGVLSDKVFKLEF